MTECFAVQGLNTFGYFDIFILVLAAVLGLRGVFRGFVRDIVVAGGFVLALLLARLLGPAVGSIFESKIGFAVAAAPVGCAVVFVGIFVASLIASRVVSSIVKSSKLGKADRVMGLLFGMMASLIIAGLAFKIYAAAMLFMNRSVEQSFLTRAATFTVELVLGI